MRIGATGRHSYQRAVHEAGGWHSADLWGGVVSRLPTHNIPVQHMYMYLAEIMRLSLYYWCLNELGRSICCCLARFSFLFLPRRITNPAAFPTSSTEMDTKYSSKIGEIYLSSRKCSRLFSRCRSISPLANDGWIEYRELEFHKWTDALQIFQAGRNSLDYRLRDHIETKRHILELLEAVSNVLNACLAGRRPQMTHTSPSDLHQPERRS